MIHSPKGRFQLRSSYRLSLCVQQRQLLIADIIEAPRAGGGGGAGVVGALRPAESTPPPVYGHFRGGRRVILTQSGNFSSFLWISQKRRSLPFRVLQGKGVSERYGYRGGGGIFLQPGAARFGGLGSTLFFPFASVIHVRCLAFPSTACCTSALFLSFLPAKLPSKAKRLILGSPRPEKGKIRPSDKLPGRQYHFYKGTSRRALIEAIPYAQQQQKLLTDMHNDNDDDAFDFNDIKQRRHTVSPL